MKSQTRLWIIVVCIVGILALGGYLIFTNDKKAEDCKRVIELNASGVTIANPAAVFCRCMDKEYKLTNTLQGEGGTCDGIDEWDYYREMTK